MGAVENHPDSRHVAMAETQLSLDDQLKELGARLDWVREYL